jgi:hypothetical protein
MVRVLSARQVRPSDNASKETCLTNVAAKTAEVDSLRFKDNDLDVVGTLEYGQFGVVGSLSRNVLKSLMELEYQIDVVTCRLNNCVYVRKSIEKQFALRTRDVCLHSAFEFACSYLNSNARPNMNGICSYKPSRRIHHGLHISSVHSKRRHIST